MAKLTQSITLKLTAIAVAMSGLSIGYANCLSPVPSKDWDRNFGQCLNSAWTYDALFEPLASNDPSTPYSLNTVTFSDPSIVKNTTYPLGSLYGYKKTAALGSQAQNIVAFNNVLNSSTTSNTNIQRGLNQLYVYGADAELFCDANGLKGNCNATPNTTGTLKGSGYAFNYLTPSTKLPSMSNYSGVLNVKKYNSILNTASNPKIEINVIVDGRVNALGVSASWLNNFKYGIVHGAGKKETVWANEIGQNYTSFNDLNQTQAYAFADSITEQICSSTKYVKGIHFDIEPFSIPTGTAPIPNSSNDTGWGQYWFYDRISQNLASEGSGASGSKTTPNTASACYKNNNKMYFSVFTFPGAFNKNMATVFNQFKNGYAVVSLYDLGGASSTGTDDDTIINSLRAGLVTSTVSYYQKKLNQLLTSLQTNSNKYGIYFQIGVPAAASAHEFALYYNLSKGCTSANCTPKLDNRLGTENKVIETLIGEKTWSFNRQIPYQTSSDGAVSGTTINTLYTDSNPTFISQTEYIKTALNSFLNYNSKALSTSKYWIGTSLWAFAVQNVWIPRYNPTSGTPKTGIDLVTCYPGYMPTTQLTIQGPGTTGESDQNYLTNMNSYGTEQFNGTTFGFCSDTVIGGPAAKVGMRVYLPTTIETTHPADNVLGTLKNSNALLLKPLPTQKTTLKKAK
ncbi:MAG: hypothetical protein P1U63_02255 [Coxiellaceae bacterium]|nr:hypothetical protein [Coxiellaceae bacterium]